MKRFVLLTVPCIALWACGDSTPPVAAPVTPPSASVPPPPPPVSATASAAAPDAGPATRPEPLPPAPAAKWTGFATPESVLWDEANDRYLVSNINGKPLDADGNGFISDISPDGKVTNLKWIAGGDKKVKLDAPKGMAIVGGTLYVTDITVVRMFDLKTGAPKGEVKLPGATFANDLSAGADGTVYVTDTGMKAGKAGFEPSDTDAVYAIDKAGKLKTIAKDKTLGRPNGVLSTDKGLIVVNFGNDEAYRLDDKGKKQDVTKLPKPGLDGVVVFGDALLISSWEGQSVYKGKLGGAFEPLLTGIKAPADIGLDKKRSRVLVPRFMDDVVEAYDVK